MTRSRRYTPVAIALHWLIAISLVALIFVGWWMGDAIEKPETRAAAYAAFQLHKAFGVTVLVLTFARLAWRLMNPPPPLTTAMPAWERFAAQATHAAFYTLAIGIPLAGLVYVSTGWIAHDDRPFSVATSYFGLFTIPHLPFIEAMAPEARRALAFMSINAHGKMAWGVLILLALHVGAALKHHFVDKDDVLARMVPVLKLQGEPGEPARDGAAPFLAGVAAVLALGVGTALIGAPEKPFPAAVEAPAPAVAPTPLPDAAPAVAPAAATSAETEKAAAPAAVPAWTVDPGASRIEFEGQHAGKGFKGRFERWSADIRFDPDKLDQSKAVVTIETGSAGTGDSTQTASLKDAEWFGPAKFPTARFETTRITALGGEKYEARGTLTIKGKSYPVVLPFTLEIKGGEAEMRGEVTLDRIALDLGVGSDPTADWVSRSIVVEVRVKAKRAA
ncbi:MAG: YceI family protein [Alphaproteobacteria bacterium]|nr:YceI family protein [Alphaproteobacteria bacterium]